MYQKILVPLDGSKLAESPLDYAAWLAQKSGAELRLIQVYKGKAPDTSRYLERKIRSLTRHATGGSRPLQITPVLVKGNPAEEILRYSEESSTDLITMSTHGRTGIKRWLMGSVADKVIRYSNRPVRLVKSFINNPLHESDYDTKVLALLDGSEMAEQALPYAVYHAKLGESRLVLLSVCEPPEIGPAVTYHLIPPHDYPPKRPLQWGKFVEQETEKRRQECRLYLEKIGELQKEKGITIKFESPLGEPVAEIIRYLEGNPVSLVVMTTRGRSGISRWVFGSVAEMVLKSSSSPVLIIRPSEDLD